MLLKSFDANTSLTTIIEALRHDGGVVVCNLVSGKLIDAGLVSYDPS